MSLNLKQIHTQNNFYNNKNGNANNFPKILESELSDKNYKNRTITYFNNNFIKFKNFTNPKIEKKMKIEKYSKIENKKNNFVCLNNMILEDIKDQIKFSFDDEKYIIRNKDKRLKMFLFSDKYNNSIITIKKEKEKEKNNSLSIEYLKTTPLFKSKKEKIDKNTEIKNKINNSKRILMLKQSFEIETDKINYDVERNNYYQKTISKRLNLFFGNKKNFIKQ